MVPFDILLTDLEGGIKVLEGRLDRVVQTNTAHRKQQVRTYTVISNRFFA